MAGTARFVRLASIGILSLMPLAALLALDAAGLSGDVCVSAGGCGRKFADNGCGGMDEGGLQDVHQ